MPQVTFTQFVLPRGEKREVSIERPQAVADKADRIIAAGLKLECEVLRTGDVSLTIADDEQDLAIKVVPNGPGVPEAVDELIINFNLPAS